MPKPQDIFARAPCCHFTWYTGCIITVYSLLLTVPTGLGWGLVGEKVQITGTWQPGRGLGARICCMCCDFYPACPCWGDPEKKFFTKAYPLSMSRITYGRILSTCTYRCNRIASHRPHIYSCWLTSVVSNTPTSFPACFPNYHCNKFHVFSFSYSLFSSRETLMFAVRHITILFSTKMSS
jgi:hypothetical protein